MKVLLGLGNPGAKYERTRHNIGFWIVDRVARRHAVAFDHASCDALIAVSEARGEAVVLAKPQTFMNRSGAAARALLEKYQVEPQDMIVVCDDLDLPFSRIRIRPQGGAGGHRGLESIRDHIGSDAFARVRIGIGRPPPGIDPAAYVLEIVDPELSVNFRPVVERAVDAVELLLSEGIERAMQEYNRAI